MNLHYIYHDVLNEDHSHTEFEIQASLVQKQKLYLSKGESYFYMKYIYTIHIETKEKTNCYYTPGISVASIPFHRAASIEFLQINLRTKEKRNFFPTFCAFQSSYKQLYKWRHSIRKRFILETTGVYPIFPFPTMYKKYFNPQ